MNVNVTEIVGLLILVVLSAPALIDFFKRLRKG